MRQKATQGDESLSTGLGAGCGAAAVLEAAREGRSTCSLHEGRLWARHQAGSWAFLHKALRRGLLRQMKRPRAREVK